MSLLVIVILTCFAGASITCIRTNPSPTLQGPDDEYFRAISSSNQKYVRNDYLVVTLLADNIFSEDALLRLAAITDEIRDLDEVAGVLSLTTLVSTTDNDGFLDLSPLIDVQAGIDPASVADLKQFLNSYQFIEELTTTVHGDGAAIVVLPAQDSDEIAFARAVLAVTDRIGIDRTYIFGKPVLIYYSSQMVFRDTTRLLITCLIIILVVQFAVTRSIYYGIILWLSAMIPCIWLLSFFVVANIELSILTVIIPVTALSLATSYGIHIHRFHATHPDTPFSTNFKKAIRIVLVACLTTCAGFSSLLASRIPMLRTIGAVSALGVALSICVVLFFLRPLYILAPKRFSTKKSLFRNTIVKPRRLYALMIAALCLIVGTGIAKVYINSQFSSIFRSKSEAKKTEVFFEANYYAGETIEVYINTDTDYQFVSVDSFRSAQNLSRQIKSLPGIAGTYSYVDLVRWLHNGMPESEVDIGESLELLSGDAVPIDIGSFIDINYSSIRIIARPEATKSDYRDFTRHIAVLEREIGHLLDNSEFADQWIIGGTAPQANRINGYFTSGQIGGFVLFIAAVFLISLVFLKDVRVSLLALLPPALSALVYMGVIGWSGAPHNVASSVGFAAILGVSVDDVMYLLIYDKRLNSSIYPESFLTSLRNAGPAIIETTFVLVLCVSMLITSYFLNLAWSGVYIIAGLITPTLVTLFVVPYIMAIMEKKRGV